MKTKKIIYSPHLKEKITERGIPDTLIKKILDAPERQFFDNETKRSINLAKVPIKGKIRNVVMIYETTPEETKAISVFIIRDRDLRSRLRRKRWVEIGN